MRRKEDNLRAIGVDVQAARECPFVVLESAGGDARCVATGWLENGTPAALGAALAEAIDEHRVGAVGIDAPRCTLPAPRRWKLSRGRWERSTKGLLGRHCEAAIRSAGVANPQWTPLAGGAIPPWMANGFALFEAAEAVTPGRVYEVFPSAAYRVLAGESGVRLEMLCGDFSPGPKDLLDAAVGALTVIEYERGRGQAVGGGDGLGAIILPRPIKDAPPEVFTWPGDEGDERGEGWMV